MPDGGKFDVHHESRSGTRLHLRAVELLRAPANADPYLVGGYLGYLGSSTAPSSRATQVPDPIIDQVGYGALRFTNGYPYAKQERGAILSTNTFNTGSGLQVTFKTITYMGDSGGGGSDGADGISFFLRTAASRRGSAPPEAALPIPVRTPTPTTMA